MACLDTSFLIDLCRRRGENRERARRKLAELRERGDALTTTRFTVAELYVGVFRSEDRTREEDAVRAVLSELVVLEFGADAAVVFGHFAARLQALGRPSGDMDILIAATALAADERTLVTRNAEHYRLLPGIDVEEY